MSERANHPCYLSPAALAGAELPPALRKVARRLAADGSAGLVAPVVAAYGSEIADGAVRLPAWAGGSDTRFLLVLDVPDAVVPRVFSALDLRRPDRRVHLTRDPGAVRRLVVSAVRVDPALGIVDAVLWRGTLHLVTGDLRFRAFPADRLPVVGTLPEAERARFTIGADGSRLHWDAGDVDLGVSQILQEADPMYLADVAIERNSADRTGTALRRLREERGLRQVDIPGLSERQVRRIEDGISRLRMATTETFAAAFGMSVRELLDAVARYAGEAGAGGGEDRLAAGRGDAGRG
jgi:hypothetical protein